MLWWDIKSNGELKIVDGSKVVGDCHSSLISILLITNGYVEENHDTTGQYEKISVEINHQSWNNSF